MESEATLTDAMGTPHPEIERLREFELGDLPDSELADIGAHLDGCATCRAVLDSLAADSVLLSKLRAAAEPGGVVAVEESERRLAARTLRDSGILRRHDRLRSTLRLQPGPRAADAERLTFPKSVGPYELLEEVGRGGMGVVYKAWHRDLNRFVALKMVLAGRFATGDDWERFRLEAGFAARVQHPHIIQLYEVGIDEGRPYLALEWAEGGTLGSRLDGVPWSPMHAARLVEVLARAVQESHRQGIIHRDLKPENVLLQVDRDAPKPLPGRPGSRSEILHGFIPKITDFGLAAAAEGNDGLTRTGAVMGTPEYMAPEQTATRPSALGPSTDVHALGAIFYELLTGRPPFRAASMLQTLELVRTAEPVRPSRLQPGLARDAEIICLKCLEKSPARRYSSAEALAEDLRRFLGHESILARPSRPWQRAARWCARNPAVSALSAAFAAALVVGLAVIVWKWREAEAGRRKVVIAEQATARQLARAVEAHGEAVRTRNESQRLSANLAMNRGLELARHGETGPASLWMLEGLTFAPDDDSALALMIRRNLTAWSTRMNGLRQVFEHPDAVTRVAISPDGRSALTGCLDMKARLWDLTTGLMIGEPWQCDGTVECVAFRPDGLVAVTGGGAIARLRDARTGKPIGKPMPHPGPAFRAVFRRDGQQLLTISKSATVLLWDARTGEPNGRVGSASRPEWVFFCADYSEDGRSIVAGMMNPRDLRLESAVQWWEIASGKPMGPVLPLPSAVLDVACSPDGRSVLTACATGTAQVWDAATWAPSGPPMVHPALVEPAVFSVDGKSVLTGCADGLARRWDVATSRQIGEPLVHQSAVWGVASDRQGRFALIGSADHIARFWELATDPDLGPPAAASPDRPIEVSRQMPRVIYSSDRHLVLSGDHQGNVKLAAIATGASVGEPMRLAAGAVQVLALAPRGARIAASSDAPGAPLAQLWDARGRPLATLPADGSGAIAMAFNPAGSMLATIDGRNRMRLWDAATGRPLAMHPSVATAAYRELAFAPDGRTLAASTTWGSSVKCLRIDAGEPYGELYKNVFPFRPGTSRVAISPDGTRILTVSAKAVRLFDATDGREVAVPVLQSNSLLDAAFSADGKLVISLCEKGDVRLWDVAAGEQFGPSMGHSSDVVAADVGRDGKFLVAVCRDGTAQPWDLATSRPIGPPLRSRSRILGALLLPDGRGIATTDETGITRVTAVPAPVAGDLETLNAYYLVRTSQRLDRHQTLTGLVPAAWRASLAQLESLEAGDPARLPGFPASSRPEPASGQTPSR